MSSSKTSLSRFKESMKMNYDKWHDGIGYDIEALNEADEKERETIEDILKANNPRNWRDIEALAILGTPGAQTTLLNSINNDHEINMAVIRYAPWLVDDKLKTGLIVKSLRSAVFYYGLRQTLHIIEDFHPPEVIDELFYGILKREDGVAVHFAAMLFYVFGEAETSFDDDKRDFFLKFNVSSYSDRLRYFKTLCEKIKVNPDKYLTNE